VGAGGAGKENSMSHSIFHALTRRGFTMSSFLSALIAAFVLFGALAAYAGASTIDSYAAAKKHNVTITVNMGKNGSNCPVLFFKKNGKTEALAYGNKFSTDGEKFDPWKKSKLWFQSHNVKVVFTTAKLPRGTYKVVCDNGTRIKTVKSKLKVTKKTKNTVSF
jgi:hypothetical protein